VRRHREQREAERDGDTQDEREALPLAAARGEARGEEDEQPCPTARAAKARSPSRRCTTGPARVVASNAAPMRPTLQSARRPPAAASGKDAAGAITPVRCRPDHPGAVGEEGARAGCRASQRPSSAKGSGRPAISASSKPKVSASSMSYQTGSSVTGKPISAARSRVAGSTSGVLQRTPSNSRACGRLRPMR
jgi:hypothetical protein